MKIERVSLDDVDWADLDRWEDRTLFQTRHWLHFLQKTQRAEPVIARLSQGNRTSGYFTGAIVRKFGVRILGSPFRGWTTSYMGFNLRDNVDREDALRLLDEFAFRRLKCLHIEIMDRYLDQESSKRAGYEYSLMSGYQIDLTLTEDEIFAKMDSACRRCIRKAQKSGVTVEEATDASIFADEYYAQLKDVFAKQDLVPTYPKTRVLALIEALPRPANLLLLRARAPDGRCIATGIFPAFGSTTYFWGGASWRPYQSLRPNEALHWHAIRYWKQRGITKYDMGGGGDYKRKYGGASIVVPWLNRSKYPLIASMRVQAKELVKSSQRLAGRTKSWITQHLLAK